MTHALYDRIGERYTSTRRPDPRIAAAIHHALGDAVSVVNVGAGAGAYEPATRSLVAVEPSWQMIRQRPDGARPAVRAAAEGLPFASGTFDAALAVLTVHHWADWRAGIAEMRRVAHRVVIFTFDPDQVGNFWLTERYFPEIADLERGRASVADLVDVLGTCRVEPVAIPHDCSDGFLAAYWRRPEAYLDRAVRAGMSGFVCLDENVVARGGARLRAELESGEWARRFGHLKALDSLDVCYRLVISH